MWIFLAALFYIPSFTLADKKIHYIHWNRANFMFKKENNDHILNVNQGNLPWEYDQVNIICPISKVGSRYPESHVIYSVSKEEYETCRIVNPKPKIVAVCNRPYSLMYFTITFRSFTPTPGGLEFKPGHDYYFISTSSREDLHRRVGGGCATHNMKMIFKVAKQETSTIKEFTTTTTTPRPSTTVRFPTSTIPQTNQRIMYNSRTSSQRRGGEYIYYYHPRDLVHLEDSYKRKMENFDSYENEIWRRNEALKFTSPSSSSSSASLIIPSLTSLVLLILTWTSMY